MKFNGRRISKNMVKSKTMTENQTRSQLDRAFQESYDTEQRTAKVNEIDNLTPYALNRRSNRLGAHATKAGAMKIDKTQVTPGKWITKTVYSMTPKYIGEIKKKTNKKGRVEK